MYSLSKENYYHLDLSHLLAQPEEPVYETDQNSVRYQAFYTEPYTSKELSYINFFKDVIGRYSLWVVKA